MSLPDILLVPGHTREPIAMLGIAFGTGMTWANLLAVPGAAGLAQQAQQAQQQARYGIYMTRHAPAVMYAQDTLPPAKIYRIVHALLRMQAAGTLRLHSHSLPPGADMQRVSDVLRVFLTYMLRHCRVSLKRKRDTVL